ncbi:MAG: TRAP transporter small permease [Burkholderiales bacterium]
MAAILIAILVGIVRRYLLGAPLVWIDELAVVLFIWCVFITGALVVRIEDHVAFELVHGALSPHVQRWVTVAAFGGAGLCLLAATPKSADFILFLSRERTPALQWRLDIVYACFVVFMVAAGLMLVAHAARLAWRDKRALPGASP